jgi:hypothetical protein
MVIFLKWLVLAVFSLCATLLSYFVVPVAALFLDPVGNLKYLRGWLQTSDNPAIGDVFWRQTYPAYSYYRLAVTWLWRNPSQGLDQRLRANVSMQTPCKVRGNMQIGDTAGVSGYYLITCAGAFHFAWVLPIGFGRCVEGGAGWRLNNIVLKYPHPTMGQIISTPFRFFTFG